MQSAVAIIKDEHRSMAAVIRGMLMNVAAIRSGAMEHDAYLFAAMFDYIETFPDRLHHPKEDEYLFRYLRQRSAASHAILDELQAEHASGADLLGQIRACLARYRQDHDLDAFESALRAYADFYLAHMAKEEKVVLPMATEHLTTQDWEAINAAFQASRDRAW